MSTMEAVTAYKRGTPLRSNSNQHKDDLAVIRRASRPMDRAERLITKRREEQIVSKVDAMLRDLQGRRKRYQYDQSAAMQLEHLTDVPFDPITQVPLWRELLSKTKGTTVDRDTFMSAAVSIFVQHDLYTPETMAG